MPDDLNQQTNRLLREQLTGLAYQLNVLNRIARFLKVISIVLILCAIILAWPFFVTALGASVVLFALSVEAIPRGMLYALLCVPVLWAIASVAIKFWSRYVSEKTSDSNGYADPAALQKIEIIRRKREKDLEKEMAEYFAKKRTEN